MNLQNEYRFRAFERLIRRKARDPALEAALGVGAAFVCGFFLSAASLGGAVLPLCMAVLCVGLPGWCGMSFAVGASLGYWTFWSYAGAQALVWVAGGLALGELLDEEKKRLPLLLAGLGTLVVAVSGLIFQIVGLEAQGGVARYLLHLAVAFGGVCLAQAGTHRNTLTDAALMAVGVLALAQIAPASFLNFGIFAATVIALEASFPAAALAGLALDLAGIVSVPMTAVTCLIWLVGHIAALPKKSRVLFPALIYLLVMALCAQTDFSPLAPLVIGGTVSLFVPRRQEPPVAAQTRKRDELQSRLEDLSSVFSQAKQLLRDTPTYPVDEGALIARAADRACVDCDRRKDCVAAERIRLLPQTLLHQNSITLADVPASCRKKERLLAHLQQSQDQYRLLQADRNRQHEYRSALMQQYGFLSDHLLTLTDAVPTQAPQFRAETAVCSRGKESANGDRCLHFAAAQNRYCIVLCDGMGTGEAAAYEARTAALMLRRMLCAGYPAAAALESINALCALREIGGAVTVDLAEADLVTGRVSLYKLGAAPSWLVTPYKQEKRGQESPPPGMSVDGVHSSVDRFSLKDGAVLFLFSDGVDGERAVMQIAAECDQPTGFLAALCLESGAADADDDATAVVLRLCPLSAEE